MACPHCGFGKITHPSTRATKCSHCGKSISVRKAVRHYEGENAEAARTALFMINAGMQPAPSKGRVEEARRKSRPQTRKEPPVKKSVEIFLSEHECFYVETLAKYLGISTEDAEKRVWKMVDGGILYSPVTGQFCVVK